MMDNEEKLILLGEIVEWLYVNDGGYNNKVSWRKSFIYMLKEKLNIVKET